MSLVPTATQLKRICQSWQRTLRLQDWVIDISYCKPTDIRNPTATAETRFDLSSKGAIIQVVHPRTGQANLNIERTIVHELLHLHISALLISKGITAVSDDEEAVISILAGAFVPLSLLAA